MRKVVASAVCGIVLLGVAGCTIDGFTEVEAGNVTEVSVMPVVEQKPRANVADGETGVNPAEPITVISLGEGLAEVTLKNAEGKIVDSSLTADGNGWKTEEPLGYGRTYSLYAEDRNGEVLQLSFQTLVPAALAATRLSPIDGAEVGVGQTIALFFDTPITRRKDVEEAIKIETTPHVDGAFYWISNHEVRWRPEKFWAPGTKVTVEAPVYGLEVANGVYAADSRRSSFTIGERVEAVVDDKTKTMKVMKSGAEVKTMPVSLGSNKFPTPNGVYVIGDQYENLVMDSRTYGLSLEAGGYRTAVDYATQLSYSGIYVHSAPWSVWAQGNSNVSHGCVNVTYENARWFQDFVKRGDIVTVKNTIGGTLSGYDGLGDWNIDWATWKKGNADA
ncbi:Ig-like domain-containing protein [Corynebacterium sp. HS2168-gen11]|uniref:L,D-transpeptidase n=1 Tax=Corynebacterium sp. HS2168-gen11 TaxID=2974027 RepID=UPI00216B5E20|nr:Ig-like domain-containing protein [Corynebacterium sp. HS2168-gen11]MCS4535304.1 Ig-like domain-containing protein [Corynebacterium sp. HS2168-gen11]